MKKIMVVEDEKKLVELIRTYLEKEGYEVIALYSGSEALTEFKNQKPDLIILDLMLPKVDGLEICREIRKVSDVPIIMLTAKAEEVDKLIGLEMGADDYVTKPFSPRELTARVKTVLRRGRKAAIDNSEIRLGTLTIAPGRHEAFVGERLLELTATEFKLLIALAKNQGRVYSRKQLIELAQGYLFEGYERTIDTHIKNLRQKLEEDPSQPKYIKTVHGVGYKFEAPKDEG